MLSLGLALPHVIEMLLINPILPGTQGIEEERLILLLYLLLLTPLTIIFNVLSLNLLITFFCSIQFAQYSFLFNSFSFSNLVIVFFSSMISVQVLYKVFSLLKFSLCLYIVHLTSVNIFMMVLLDSLSGKSYMSIPLGSASSNIILSLENISVFLHFSLTVLCWYLNSRQNSFFSPPSQTGPVLEKMLARDSKSFSYLHAVSMCFLCSQ